MAPRLSHGLLGAAAPPPPVGRRRHACVLRERQEPSRPAEAVVEGRLDLHLPPARATVHHGELVEREPHHGTRQGQVWEEIKPSFQSAIAGGVLSPCAAGNRRPPYHCLFLRLRQRLVGTTPSYASNKGGPQPLTAPRSCRCRMPNCQAMMMPVFGVLY